MKLKALVLHFQSVIWNQASEKTQLRTSREIMLLILIMLLLVSRTSIAESALHTSTGGVVIPCLISEDDLSFVNITSNEDFVSQGWPGTGTANDPFLISNLGFMTDICVSIFNTTSYFVIRNCAFWGIETYPLCSTGVLLANVTNGVLEYNRFAGMKYGFLLDNVTHCRISKNLMELCSTGIELSSTHSSAVLGNEMASVDIGLMSSRCSNCTVANNIFYDGWQEFSTGIWMDDPDSCVLENNTIDCLEEGIWIRGGNSRVTANTIGNCNMGLELEGTSSRATENIISNCDIGIELEGNNSRVTANIISYCERGIRLYYSRNSTLDFNRVHNNTIGIHLENSTDCLIVDNLVYNNSHYGIFLNSFCIRNRVFANKIGWNSVNAKCDGANNSWDDGVNHGNSWSDCYGLYQYVIPGEGQCIDHYPTPWFPPRTYEVSVLLLLGGVLYLLPVAIVVLGPRWREAYRVWLLERKKRRETYDAWRETYGEEIRRLKEVRLIEERRRRSYKDDIIVPTAYRLMSWLHKKKALKHEDIDELLEPDSSDQ